MYKKLTKYEFADKEILIKLLGYYPFSGSKNPFVNVVIINFTK